MPLPARDTLDYLLDQAKKAGAINADARIAHAQSSSLGIRMGALETLIRDEAQNASLRVFMGQRQASASSSDLSASALRELAERVVAMARLAPEDPFCGLAPRPAQPPVQPDAHDSKQYSSLELEGLAREAEEAALGIPGIANSGGAEAEWSQYQAQLGASDGFRGEISSSSYAISVSAIAQKDDAMERDWDAASRRFHGDLPTPASIGRNAGERAARRLGARKLDSQRANVLFETRTARSLLGLFVSAASGSAIARGSSFLRDHLGKKVFGANIQILDDPTEAKGLGSRQFDGEGCPVQALWMVKDGILQHYFLNWPAARQLGMESTGHASPGFGDPPGISPSNLRLMSGTQTCADLLKDAGACLWVSEMFGPSINMNNGDYSVGVSGFWYDQGGLAYPVSEITVAGNLLDIFARLIPANDLVYERAYETPSLLVPDLAIAGR